jgi:hypothetical protein
LERKNAINPIIEMTINVVTNLNELFIVCFLFDLIVRYRYYFLVVNLIASILACSGSM